MPDERRRECANGPAVGIGCLRGVATGLAVAIETCWPILRDPDYVQKVTRLHQRLAGPTQPATVVMLGSSRTAFGFDGAVCGA